MRLACDSLELQLGLSDGPMYWSVPGGILVLRSWRSSEILSTEQVMAWMLHCQLQGSGLCVVQSHM